MCWLFISRPRFCFVVNQILSLNNSITNLYCICEAFALGKNFRGSRLFAPLHLGRCINCKSRVHSYLYRKGSLRSAQLFASFNNFFDFSDHW